MFGAKLKNELNVQTYLVWDCWILWEERRLFRCLRILKTLKQLKQVCAITKMNAIFVYLIRRVIIVNIGFNVDTSAEEPTQVPCTSSHNKPFYNYMFRRYLND